MNGDNEFSKTAYRVSVISIVVNIFLSVIKLLIGFFAHSVALVSDAVHSASDVFSTFIVIIGVKLSAKANDEDHPYGHERLECIAALILASILAATGIGIGLSGVSVIVKGDYLSLKVPGKAALFAAALSIAVKEWMFWYTRAKAKKINSNALMADAWHHRSDALSSVGSFVGILGAILGVRILDPIASLAISLLIIKAAFDIYKDAVSKLTDRAADKETTQRIKDLILNCKSVKSVDELKTRLFGSKIYVDVEISVNGSLPLFSAHEAAQSVHDMIEKNFPEVKHCMVHVNPYDGEETKG